MCLILELKYHWKFDRSDTELYFQRWYLIRFPKQTDSHVYKNPPFFISASQMDQLKEFIEPAIEFANDSKRLVNRCTKPDRKGVFFQLWSISYGCRVPEDCYRHGDWLRAHGLHWLLREACAYPHQQHYCVRLFFFHLQLQLTLRRSWFIFFTRPSRIKYYFPSISTFFVTAVFRTCMLWKDLSSNCGLQSHC